MNFEEVPEMPPKTARRKDTSRFEVCEIGKNYRAVQGVGFTCSAVSFASAAINYAKAKGMKATTRRLGDEVYWRFEAKNGEPEQTLERR